MSDEDHNEDVDDSCDQCVWALNKKHDAVAHTKSLHGDTHYERENVMDSISSDDEVEYLQENESFDLNRLNEEKIKQNRGWLRKAVLQVKSENILVVFTK